MRVLVSEDIWSFDLQAALKEISPQRREQALKFKHAQGQRLCVLVYQLLKQGLFEEYGIRDNPVFEYNEHGKPSIAGHPDIHFNLSHCAKAAVCVISTHPVGIDVESVRPLKDSLMHYTMNDGEIAQIERSADPEAAFVRLWTMKEATQKLSGQGISNNMKDVISEACRYTTVEPIGRGYIYTIAEYK